MASAAVKRWRATLSPQGWRQTTMTRIRSRDVRQGESASGMCIWNGGTAHQDQRRTVLFSSSHHSHGPHLLACSCHTRVPRRCCVGRLHTLPDLFLIRQNTTPTPCLCGWGTRVSVLGRPGSNPICQLDSLLNPGRKRASVWRIIYLTENTCKQTVQHGVRFSLWPLAIADFSGGPYHF